MSRWGPGCTGAPATSCRWRRGSSGATGMPVGVLEGAPYKTGECTLAAGDLITLYSDGIPETQKIDDEDEYGAGMCQLLLDHDALEQEQIDRQVERRAMPQAAMLVEGVAAQADLAHVLEAEALADSLLRESGRAQDRGDPAQSVRVDALALVRLLDAPVDHVAERGELAHLLL